MQLVISAWKLYVYDILSQKFDSTTNEMISFRKLMYSKPSAHNTTESIDNFLNKIRTDFKLQIPTFTEYKRDVAINDILNQS